MTTVLDSTSSDNLSPKRVLVCGSRYLTHRQFVFANLDKLSRQAHEVGCRIDTIINGGAAGVDNLATDWAISRHIKLEIYPITPDQWASHGKRAGYLRNQRMLDEGKPDLVVAFFKTGAENRGTHLMCQLAKRAGVTTWESYGD